MFLSKRLTSARFKWFWVKCEKKTDQSNELSESRTTKIVGSQTSLGIDCNKNVAIKEMKFSGVTTQVSRVGYIQLSDVVKNCRNIESLGKLFLADKRSQENMLASETFNATFKFIGEQFEVRLLWKGSQARLNTNYSSALGPLKSVQRQLASDQQLF